MHRIFQLGSVIRDPVLISTHTRRLYMPPAFGCTMYTHAQQNSPPKIGDVPRCSRSAKAALALWCARSHNAIDHRCGAGAYRQGVLPGPVEPPADARSRLCLPAVGVPRLQRVGQRRAAHRTTRLLAEAVDHPAPQAAEVEDVATGELLRHDEPALEAVPHASVADGARLHFVHLFCTQLHTAINVLTKMRLSIARSTLHKHTQHTDRVWTRSLLLSLPRQAQQRIHTPWLLVSLRHFELTKSEPPLVDAAMVLCHAVVHAL